MTTLDISHRDNTRLTRFITAAQSGHPWLWYSAIALSVGAIACIGLQLVDARELNGANVWVKPAKFFFSLAVHLVTVSWALSLFSQRSRAVRVAIPAMVMASWIEMIYIIARAARGEASHFNVATPFDALLYSLMGDRCRDDHRDELRNRLELVETSSHITDRGSCKCWPYAGGRAWHNYGCLSELANRTQCRWGSD
jgi:hypothetical protein